jgi:hypothetical protein
MSESPARPSGSDSAALPQPLTDRVLARVSEAGLALDRRARATRPRASRRRPAARDPLSASVTRTPEQLREERALRRVFLDMGDSYHAYRRRTGAPVSPAVRDAAYRFKRELNITSLVAVAARLEELDTLTW